MDGVIVFFASFVAGMRHTVTGLLYLCSSRWEGKTYKTCLGGKQLNLYNNEKHYSLTTTLVAAFAAGIVASDRSCCATKQDDRSIVQPDGDGHHGACDGSPSRPER